MDRVAGRARALPRAGCAPDRRQARRTAWCPRPAPARACARCSNALEADKRGKLRVVASDGEFDSIDFILRVYREKGRIDLRLMPWREISVGNADLRGAVQRDVPQRRAGACAQQAGACGAHRGRAGAAGRLPPCRRAAAGCRRAGRGFRHRRLLQVPARRARRLLALRAPGPGRDAAHARHRLVRQARALRPRAARSAAVRRGRRCLAGIHAAGARAASRRWPGWR